MDVRGLAEDMDRGLAVAVNIGRSGARGFQVSVRRTYQSDGWEVYYGPDLGDVLDRALSGGPQGPASDDDFGGLV